MQYPTAEVVPSVFVHATTKSTLSRLLPKAASIHIHTPPPIACTSASNSSPAARVAPPTSRPAKYASKVHSVLSPHSCDGQNTNR